MDADILQTLDPHGYYSELSLFQSTPAAIAMLQGAHVRHTLNIIPTEPLMLNIIPAAPLMPHPSLLMS